MCKHTRFQQYTLGLEVRTQRGVLYLEGRLSNYTVPRYHQDIQGVHISIPFNKLQRSYRTQDSNQEKSVYAVGQTAVLQDEYRWNIVVLEEIQS